MKPVFTHARAAALLIGCLIFILPVLAQDQPDQKIWTQYCVASPDSACFDPVEGKVDSVGRDVGELAGDFLFCLEVDTVDSGFAPLRVILALDASNSMCRHYGPDGCCVAGDGSGLCAKNDPQNRRVEAAIAFVNNLAQLSPQSEVGVITYSSSPTVAIEPTLLTSAENINNINAAIAGAECSANDTIDRFLDDPEDEEEVAMAKTAAGGGGFGGAGTNLGRALIRALQEVDSDYNSLPAFMTRHIILLTDGGWDDVSSNPPNSIIEDYQTDSETADRPLPRIHGVFLSDSVTHVAHQYPAHGCSSNGQVELDNLQTASEGLSGGLFFGGSTPQTVVQHFNDLLDSVIQTAPQQLGSLEVTNTTNGKVSTNGAVRQVGTSPTWETALTSLPLEFGPNNLSVKRVILRPGMADSIVTTSVTIIRSDRYRESIDTDLFKQYCELVDATINITATPASQAKNAPVAVNATLSDALQFNISEVQVRLLSKFPDSENGAIATFHLDENLINATKEGNNGTGDPEYTTSSQLFGTGAISGGNFLYTIPTLNDAFLFEEWVKPSSGKAILISGGGIEFGVDANSLLYFKNGDDIIATATVPIDHSVWSHVAVARVNSTVLLFINGSAVSELSPLTTPINGGALTFSAPNRWVVDEIRINNTSRIVTTNDAHTLTMPTVANPQWTLTETPSNGPTLSVPSTAWTNGTSLDFTFSSPVPGTMVVNISQAQSGAAVGTGWSKNSNPVNIISDQQGPYVLKGILDYKNNTDMDTLRIEFSEPVRCDLLTQDPGVSSSFEILREGKVLLEATRNAKYLDKCPENDMITEISIEVTPGVIIPGTDSVKLIGKTEDATGNSPDTDSLGPVIRGNGAGMAIKPVKSLPNLEIEPRLVRELGLKEDYGKVIMLETVLPLYAVDTIGDTISYGNATIYDAVGNVVARNKRIVESEVPRKYYTLWNGLNLNGRRVGPGGYYIWLSYKFIDGRGGSEGKKFLMPK